MAGVRRCNELTSDRTYHYLYDAEGNRIAKFVDVNANGLVDAGDADVTEYSWDHRKRLVRVIQSEGGEDVRWIDYSYDAANQLISRAEAYFDGSNENSIFVYEDGQIVFEFHEEILGSVLVGDLEAQDLLRRLLWGPAVDQLLADERVEDLFTPIDNEILWALTDHLGSVRDVVDNAGVERTHKNYDSFGNVVGETHYNTSGASVSVGMAGYMTEEFAYTGRFFDTATGLQNNLNRWYDASTGRWLSEDPLGFAAGDANLSRYVGNEPIGEVDSYGLAVAEATAAWYTLPSLSAGAVAFLTPILAAGAGYGGYQLGSKIDDAGLNPFTPLLVGATNFATSAGDEGIYLQGIQDQIDQLQNEIADLQDKMDSIQNADHGIVEGYDTSKTGQLLRQKLKELADLLSRKKQP